MTESPQTHLLLNLDQAARGLAVSRRTLQALIYRGELPSVRIGRCRRIAAADLQRFVEGLRQQQQTGDSERRPRLLAAGDKP